MKSQQNQINSIWAEHKKTPKVSVDFLRMRVKRSCEVSLLRPVSFLPGLLFFFGHRQISVVVKLQNGNVDSRLNSDLSELGYG